MNETSKTVIFFGNERLATGIETPDTPILRGLIKAGYKIEAVVLSQKPSLSRQPKQPGIIQLAKSKDIDIWQNLDFSILEQKIKSSHAKIGVLAAYGKIVPENIINAFEFGIINIHPSLLPQYRGPTPIESAILDGCIKTGVSLMQLSKKMDAGGVFDQVEIKLTGTETKQQLAYILAKQGSDLLLKNLPLILKGQAKAIVQDDSKATYCQLISSAGSLLDPNKSSTILEREVRAHNPWPGSRLQIGSLWITILSAVASDFAVEPGKLTANNKRLYYGCKNGSLEILELKPAGKKNMSASAFINGYSHILNS